MLIHASKLQQPEQEGAQEWYQEAKVRLRWSLVLPGCSLIGSRIVSQDQQVPFNERCRPKVPQEQQVYVYVASHILETMADTCITDAKIGSEKAYV